MSWEDKRSVSISRSLAVFAVRNFCVSREAMEEAWEVGEWEDTRSAWWVERVVWVRESSFISLENNWKERGEGIYFLTRIQLRGRANRGLGRGWRGIR